VLISLSSRRISPLVFDERLVLQVLNDKKNWVAWTPEGFYDATPGAFGVLKWHVNRGNDAAADAVPVSAIPKLYRPDALPLVLQEFETARPLGIDDVAAARSDVKMATGAAVAPGAQLDILAIGISVYGDKATNLRLKFAGKMPKPTLSSALILCGQLHRPNVFRAAMHLPDMTPYLS
jgi:hypothetical protein